MHIELHIIDTYDTTVRSCLLYHAMDSVFHSEGHEMSPNVEPWVQLKDFNFSFGPILNWLRAIGINLREDQSTKWRIWKKIYQSTWLLINITVQISHVIYVCEREEAGSAWIKEQKHTLTYSTIYYMDTINVTAQILGNQMGLLFLTKVRWNDLWNALEEMKHLVAPTFHVQLRKISIVGVIYIILSVEFNEFMLHNLIEM